MSAHTPAPWATFWHEENLRLGLGCWRFTHGNTHHALPLLRCSEDNGAARANARLIAAAPEMLAALKYAEEILLSYGTTKVGIHHAAIEKCRAAIAKAVSP